MAEAATHSARGRNPRAARMSHPAGLAGLPYPYQARLKKMRPDALSPNCGQNDVINLHQDKIDQGQRKGF